MIHEFDLSTGNLSKGYFCGEGVRPLVFSDEFEDDGVVVLEERLMPVAVEFVARGIGGVEGAFHDVVVGCHIGKFGQFVLAHYSAVLGLRSVLTSVSTWVSCVLQKARSSWARLSCVVSWSMASSPRSTLPTMVSSSARAASYVS